MGTYSWKGSIGFDDLTKELKVLKKEAIDVDKIISAIGNRGNLNDLIIHFLKLDDMIDTTRQSADKLKSSFAGEMKSGFLTKLDGELGKLSGVLKTTTEMSQNILNVDINTKEASKQLKQFAGKMNGIFSELGVDKKIDFDFFNVQSLEDQRKELLEHVKNIGSQITFSIGELNAGGGGTGNQIEDALQNVIDGIEQKNQQLIAAKEKYQNILSEFNEVNKKKGTISDDYKVELTEESINSLIVAYDKLQSELNATEKGSNQYIDTLNNLVKVSLKLKKAYSEIKLNPELGNALKNMPPGSVKGEEHLYGALTTYAISKNPITEDVLKTFETSYDPKINKNNKLVEELKVNNSINEVLEKRTKKYNDLQQKLYEYRSAQIAYDKAGNEKEEDKAFEKMEKAKNDIKELIGGNNNLKSISGIIDDFENDKKISTESAAKSIYKKLGFMRPDEFKSTLDEFITPNDAMRAGGLSGTSQTGDVTKDEYEEVVQQLAGLEGQIGLLKQQNVELSEQLDKQKAINDEIKQRNTLLEKSKSSSDFAPYETGLNNALDLIQNNISKKDLDDWYINADGEAKKRIENALYSNAELRNAALNIAWENYKKNTKKDISFSDFLYTDVDMYRAKNNEDYFYENDYLSFTTREDVAKRFGEVLLKTPVKPIDTLGSASLNHENEFFVPRNKIESRPEVKEWLANLQKHQESQLQQQVEEISKYLQNYPEDYVRNFLESKGYKNADELINKAKNINVNDTNVEDSSTLNQSKDVAKDEHDAVVQENEALKEKKQLLEQNSAALNEEAAKKQELLDATKKELEAEIAYSKAVDADLSEAKFELEVEKEHTAELEKQNAELKEQLEFQKQIAAQDNLSDNDDELNDIQRENGALEDKLKILREIAEAHGSNITQRDRNSLEKLVDEDNEKGLTDKKYERMSELQEKINEADASLEELGQTYEKIILKLADGKKIEILPNDKGLRDLLKFSDEGFGESFKGVDITDVEFERIKKDLSIEIPQAAQKTEAAIKEVRQEQRELFETPNGQITMFGGMGDDIRKADKEAEEFKDDIKEITQLDGQISFDEVIAEIDVAKQKVEEFYRLLSEVSRLAFIGSLNDIDIGKYTVRLEAARAELDPFIRNQQISTEMAKEIDSAFAKTRTELSEAHFSYESSLYEGLVGEENVRAAEKEAESLREQNERLEADVSNLKEELIETENALKASDDFGDTIDHMLAEETKKNEQLQQELNLLKTKNEELNEQFNKLKVINDELKQRDELIDRVENIDDNDSQLSVKKTEEKSHKTVDTANKEKISIATVVQSEVDDINKLKAPIKEVTDAVGRKTKAFIDEGTTVGQVVGKEVSALKKLENTLGDVKTEVDTKTKAFIDESRIVEQTVGKEIATLKRLEEELEEVKKNAKIDVNIQYKETTSIDKKQEDDIQDKYIEMQEKDGSFTKKRGRYEINYSMIMDYDFFSAEAQKDQMSTEAKQAFDVYEKKYQELINLKDDFNSIEYFGEGEKEEWTKELNVLTKEVRELGSAFNKLRKDSLKKYTISQGITKDFDFFSAEALNGQLSTEAEQAFKAYVTKYQELIQLKDEFNSTEWFDENAKEGTLSALNDLEKKVKELGNIFNQLRKNSVKKYEVNQGIISDFDFFNAEVQKDQMSGEAQQSFDVYEAQYKELIRLKDEFNAKEWTDENARNKALSDLNALEKKVKELGVVFNKLRQNSVKKYTVSESMTKDFNFFSEEAQSGQLADEAKQAFSVYEVKYKELIRLKDEFNATEWIDESAKNKALNNLDALEKKVKELGNTFNQLRKGSAKKYTVNQGIIKGFDFFSEEAQNNQLSTEAKQAFSDYESKYKELIQLKDEFNATDWIDEEEKNKALSSLNALEQKVKELGNTFNQLRKNSVKKYEISESITKDFNFFNAEVLNGQLSTGVEQAFNAYVTKYQELIELKDEFNSKEWTDENAKKETLDTLNILEKKVKELGSAFNKLRQDSVKKYEINQGIIKDFDFFSAESQKDQMSTEAKQAFDAYETEYKELIRLKDEFNAKEWVSEEEKNKALTVLNVLEKKVKELGSAFDQLRKDSVKKYTVSQNTIRDFDFFSAEALKGQLSTEAEQAFNVYATKYKELIELKDEFNSKEWTDENARNKVLSTLNALEQKVKELGGVFNKLRQDSVKKYEINQGVISDFDFFSAEVLNGQLSGEAKQAFDTYKKQYQELIRLKDEFNSKEWTDENARNKALSDLNVLEKKVKELGGIFNQLRKDSVKKYEINQGVIKDFDFLNAQAQKNQLAGTAEQTFNAYEAKYKELINLKDQFNKTNWVNEEDKNKEISRLNALTKEVQELGSAFDKIRKDSEKTIAGAGIDNVSKDPVDKTVVDDIKKLEAAMKEWAKAVEQGSIRNEHFDETLKQFTYEVYNADDSIEKVTISLDEYSSKMVRATKDAGQHIGTFGKLFKAMSKGFGNVFRYVSSFVGFYEVINVFRTGITYIREIDAALTELKKVTDETDATYERFLDTMSQTAGKVGSTVSELTSMAADWARLGYTIQEAGELAENTAILMNVSEFENVSDATDSLISALKAFNYEAKDSLHLVDIFNSIGNNFAISTSDLASSLTKSASALVTAGVGIEESAALLTGANTIMQDPDTVSQGLKIIALRIRGVKTELENMGESTDDVLNTAKLQAKIKALTGVDILDENNGFRNIYDILMDIADVWEELDSMSQAAVVELMAGKNRANIFTALMVQAQTIKDAYEVAINSEGSALRENEAYLDSIQGRIDIFTNSVQTAWENIINTEVVKFIVDLGTALVDTFGNIPGVLAIVTAGLAGIVKLNMAFNKGSMIANIGFYIKDIISASKKAKAATTALIIANEKLTLSQAIARVEMYRAAYAAGTMTAAEYRAAVAAMGLNGALANLIVTLKSLNPLLYVAAGMVAAGFAIDHFTTTAREAADATHDAFTEIQSAVDQTTSTISSLESELSKVEDQIKAFDREQLSFIDSEELKRLQAQKAELENNIARQKEILELQKKVRAESAINAAKAYTKVSSPGSEKTEKRWEIAGTIVGGLAGTALSLFLPDLGTLIPGGAAVGAAVSKTIGKVFSKTIGKVFSKTIGTAITKVTKVAGKEIAEEIIEEGAKKVVKKGATAATTAGGAILGNKVGEVTGSEAAANDGSYDDWYDTYNKAREAAEAKRNKEYTKYKEGDADDIKQMEKWRAAEAELTEIESDMYDHINQIQSYMSGLEYIDEDSAADPDEARRINEKLDEWNMFLDKFLVKEGAKDAKNNALNRIFGENASDEIKTIKQQILDTITAGKKFDFETAINGSEELKGILDYIGITIEEVEGYFTQFGEDLIKGISEKEIIAFKSYSALTADVEKYNSVLLQSNEYLANGVLVTEDYYNALTELGISENDLSECIDKNNGYMVTNADLLQDIVKITKKKSAANVKLAKSQSRLKYYELYNQMYQLSKGSGELTGSTLDQVNALYDQMNAVEKTISKYSMLEQQLLGTTNAFAKFEEAKTADSETDYIGTAESMMQALSEAFSTAELGTETAQTAIAGLIREDLYKDLNTANEKMAAIYDEFKNGKLSRYFSIQFNEDDGTIESIEMKLKNLKNFIEDGMSKGVFTGTNWEHFDLSEDIKTLDEFAEKMEITTDIAFAFFETIEDHNIEYLNGDYSNLFDKLNPNILKIKEFGKQMQDEFDQVNVDLTMRPRISWEKMKEAHWEVPEGEYSTVHTQTYLASDFGLTSRGSENDYYINVTPILPNGDVIDNRKDGNGLRDYIIGEINSGKSIEDLDVFIGSYINPGDPGAAISKLDEMQKDYYTMKDNYSLEENIYNNIHALADLEHQLVNGKISAEDYIKQFNELNSESQELTISAREQAKVWREKTSQLEEYKKLISDYEKQLKTGKDNEGNELSVKQVQDIEGAIKWLTSQIDNLVIDLEEPTEITLQFSMDAIDEDLKEITERIGEVIEGTHYEFNVETEEYQVILDKDDPNYQEVVNFVELMNEKHFIELQLGEETPTVTEQLSSIAISLENIVDILSNKYKISVDTSESTTKVNALLEKIRKIGLSSPFTAGLFVNTNGATNASGASNTTGTAHATGGWGLPKAEDDSLVGELGAELVVDPHSGRYYTVGDNGAEMVDLPKDAIIFDHKQTEGLLTHGHINSRGKAYAEGNAHLVSVFTNGASDDERKDNKSKKDKESKSSEGAAKQVVDFAETKLEEIENTISKTSANIENIVDNTSQIVIKNQYYDKLVEAEKDKAKTYLSSAETYNKKAKELLEKIPEKYRDMAENGALEIEEFVGDDESKLAESIQEYREMAQKADDAEIGYLESIAEISALRVQQIEDIADDFDNIIGLIEGQSNLFQSSMDLIEASGERIHANSYKKQIELTNKILAEQIKKRDQLQTELNEAVALGDIQVGSDDWYSLKNLIMECDEGILQCKIDIEEFQNAINDLKWDNLDKFISELDSIDSQLSHLHGLLSDQEDLLKDFDSHSDGIGEKFTTALGVLTQQMELAQYKSQQYAKSIEDLQKDYAGGLYSTDEYNEKLAELLENQWSSIDAYESTKDAIVDLHRTRIDEIKKGIEKEIEAYSELIEKKKEALQADKDAYDWEKTVKEKEKNISTLQKQLAALSTDSSASANAKRRQLQAELNEAMQDLNDTYYDHSIETQQDSLDKELESFEQNKQDEMDTLDKWLEDQDAVIKESFDLVKENASTVLGEINDVAQEYGIQISDAIVSPWEAGTNAVYGYQDAFNSTIGDLSASADAFIGKLNGIKEAQEALANKNSNPEQIIEEQKKVFEGIGSDYNAGYVGMSQEDFDALKAAETAWWAAKAAGDKEAMNAAHAAAEAIRSGYGYSGGGDGSEFIVNGNHSNYSGSNASDSTSQYNAGQVGMSRDDYNTIEEAKKEWAAAKAAGDEAGMKAAHEKAEAVRDEYGYSGGGDGSEYIEKKKKYAKGITSTSKDAWAIIDELGDELVLHAGENGKLAYLTKGTGVVPHNLTERLMDLALDPTSVLESSKPNIGAPQITTNNMNIDLSFGSLVHVDSCNQDTIPQLQKMVQTEVNNMVKGLNQGLKRFVR